MSDSTETVVSPTGKPVMPPWLAPIAAGLTGLASGLVLVFPPYTIAGKVCAFLASLGGVIGILSPGARTQPK